MILETEKDPDGVYRVKRIRPEGLADFFREGYVTVAPGGIDRSCSTFWRTGPKGPIIVGMDFGKEPGHAL